VWHMPGGALARQPPRADSRVPTAAGGLTELPGVRGLPAGLLSFSEPMITVTLILWCVVVGMGQRSDSSRRRPHGQPC